METITTTIVKTSWFNTPYDSSMYHKFKRHTTWLIDTCELELTGRYKYVRSSPTEWDIEVEYFYTPAVDERVFTGIEYDARYCITTTSKVEKVEQSWAELGDGLEYRPIKRAWISSNDIEIETTVEYVKEVSEIMECK